jgi:hypothetical protein
MSSRGTLDTLLRASLASGIALWLCACDGVIGNSSDNPTLDEPPIPGASTDREYAPLTPYPAAMMRLTQAQYLNSIEDVFDADVVSTTALPLDNVDEDFLSIGASFVSSTEGAVERYRDAAIDAAQRILSNRERYPVLRDCTPQDAMDPCISETVRHYARKLWRRPVTEDEVARHAAIAQAAGSGAENADLGLRYVLASLLHAPSFVYITHIGEPDTSTGSRRYTSVEMASRLSYFLWNSAPDDSLLAAAEAGDLVDPEEIRAQVERMLDDERAADLAERFFGRNWNVDRLNAEAKDPVLFPEWTASMADAALQEFRMGLDAATASDARILDVFSARETYVNAELAALYDYPISSAEFQRVPLDDNRAGLLTSPAVLAANAKPNRTSPTQRGLFIRANLLCLPVPPPPDNVNFNLEEVGGADLSVRERLELHRSEPACAGCHALFDPIGMTFENFDSLGRYRTYDGEFEIDPSTTFEDVALSSARDLADFVRDDPRTVTCLAERLYGFATGHLPTEGEQGVIDALGDYLLANDEAFREMVVGLTTSTGFRYIGQEEAQP